jgi:large subunit ribosomal protein L3
MPTRSRPRKGSLQFWPRKRAKKFLPRVNWQKVSGDSSFLGFITYKAGMGTAVVKDNYEKSLTKNKLVSIPVTILEAPNMKIFSVRFYKDSKVIKEIIVSNSKALKSKLKLPKSKIDFSKSLEGLKGLKYENIRVIVHSIPSQTSVKKNPDLIELEVKGSNIEEKLELVKSFIDKEITLEDFINSYKLVDIRGLTTGKGFQGPVKRFGIKTRSHKSEKGVRKVGSIAPWHPARVTFRTPMAGQLGMFSRVHYNSNIIGFGKISEKDINPKSGFKNYGKIKSSYVILKGSVQGPAKRQVLLTPASRPSKEQSKKNYEFQELVK